LGGQLNRLAHGRPGVHPAVARPDP
jgi:hypothetical protein